MCQIFSCQRASSTFALRATADKPPRLSSERCEYKAEPFSRNGPALRSQLVENTGIEPVTSCVQSRRSPS